MLDPSDRKILITIVNILRHLMEKIDDIQEKIGNFSKDMEIIRNNQIEVHNFLN